MAAPHVMPLLAHPAGTAMPPAGSYFNDDFVFHFLTVAPLIRQRVRGLLR